MENLVGLKERLTAIGEFANESVKLIDDLLAEKAPVKEKEVKSAKKEEKTVKKEEKTVKKEEKAPAKADKTAKTTKPVTKATKKEVDLEAIIEEYELDKMSVPELKELLNDAEIDYNKKAKAVTALAPIVAQAIADGKIALEEDEEEVDEDEETEDEESEDEEGETEEATEEEIQAVIEEYGLDEWKLPDLKEFCTDNELEFPAKAKAPALVTLIAKAIAEGVITPDEEEDEEDEDSDDDSDESDDAGNESEEEEEVEVSEDVVKAESKIRKDIAAKVKSGKLTTKKMKEFLKQYYEGDPDCKDCKGCQEDEIIECYTNIHVALVDDDGDVAEMGNPYTRRGVDFCCGKELQEMEDGTLYCEICGESYDAE